MGMTTCTDVKINNEDYSVLNIPLTDPTNCSLELSITFMIIYHIYASQYKKVPACHAHKRDQICNSNWDHVTRSLSSHINP